MKWRWPLLAGGAVLLLAGLGWVVLDLVQEAHEPIFVGILHSESGAMAISETSMRDGEVLALEEINASGGLLGRQVKWVVRDGRSDWPTFASEAQQLIEKDKVCVIFGCWTSASRKSVKPVVERFNHLLIYPMAYEGLESSTNIIYTGAAPNQQIIPAVKWSYDYLKARRFFLVGSDYIWPHCVNEIVKDQLKALQANLVGEEYIFFGSSRVGSVIGKIQESQPDVILSTVVGDTNIAFHQKLREAGIHPTDRDGKKGIPVVSFSIAEDELRKLSPADMAGNYSAWNYFQSIPRQENIDFVRAFKARYGQDRVTNDVTTAAYNSVKLWAQAVREAGTTDVQYVRESIRHQSLNAPEGVVSIDPATHHTWRPVYIGQAQTDGQFKIEWTSAKPVRPVPYPISRSKAKWDELVTKLHEDWDKRWANPVDSSRKASP